MDEGRGVGRHAVVRAAPGHEVQFTGFARHPILNEVLDERGDGVVRQQPAEELRFGHETRMRRLHRGALVDDALGDAEVRPEPPGLGYDSCCWLAAVGSDPTLVSNASISSVASQPRPSSAPYTSTDGDWSMSPDEVIFRLAASSSGAVGAQCCHPSITAVARVGGHARWKFVAAGAGTGRKTNDVTTPKFPAPAPRSAQKRSSWWCSSHSRTRPSARTTSAPTSKSDVTP